MKTSFRLTLGICALIVLLESFVCGAQTKQEKPNVLFILVDQFRQDLAGIYGGKEIETPNIDRLGSSGIVFENAVSTCPVCTPYRGMLLTGMYPTHTGILVNFVNVDSNHYKNTLGELFANAGYQTGYIGKWHLGAGGWTNYGNEPNGKVGIDRENNFIPPGAGRLGFNYWAAYNFHMQFNNYFYFTDSPEKIQTNQYEADIQVSQAIDFMEKEKQERQPFFLVVSTHPPHPPFSGETVPEGYLNKVPKSFQWSPNIPENNNPRTLEAMRYYLAMAKNIDDNVGRLLDYLENSGLDKNTIVVFTSDHGEMHGSHGYLNKQMPYSEAINIPLIYRIPGESKEGIRKKTPFTPMDHLPTLCTLVGVRLPTEKDGVDLSKVLRNPKKEENREVLMGNYVSNYNTFSSGTSFPEWRGVYTGKYTYVKWLTGEEELYDNARDPFQLNNLAQNKQKSEQIMRFRKRMDALLNEAGDQFLPGTAYSKWFDENRYPKLNMIPAK